MTFDEATHTYKVNGLIVPSVTKVLSDLLPCYQAKDSAWHMQRGRAVHACAAMIARGEPFDFDPAIHEQVLAIRRFFADLKPVVAGVERQLYSSRYRFAGTCDLIARLSKKSALVLIDWKASFSPSLPYQLAAYSLAAEETLDEHIASGVGVEIHDDGTYKMSEVYNLRRYKAGFLALLGAYNIRRACGIKEERK